RPASGIKNWRAAGLQGWTLVCGGKKPGKQHITSGSRTQASITLVVQPDGGEHALDCRQPTSGGLRLPSSHALSSDRGSMPGACICEWRCRDQFSGTSVGRDPWTVRCVVSARGMSRRWPHPEFRCLGRSEFRTSAKCL
ncbi:uncharacterized protein METZ01_LOCUS308276, partial [marine metagenome]